MKLPDDADKI